MKLSARGPATVLQGLSVLLTGAALVCLVRNPVLAVPLAVIAGSCAGAGAAGGSKRLFRYLAITDTLVIVYSILAAAVSATLTH